MMRFLIVSFLIIQKLAVLVSAKRVMAIEPNKVTLMKILSIFLAMVVGTIDPRSAIASDELSQREIRARVEAGEILSLDQLLNLHPQLLESKLLDLEVELDGTSVIYELEILTNSGSVQEVKLDAHTGEIVEKSEDD